MDDRSRPNEWNIRPHAHARLCHLFLITHGSGAMTVEGEEIAFAAPCVLLVPAGAVHGFVLEAESSGQVLTLSADYLDDLTLRDRDLASVFRKASSLSVEGEAMATRLAILERELNWRAPGHVAAVEGLLLGLLADILRLMHMSDTATRAWTGPHEELVARFRELVERRYRTDGQLEIYAAALGVTAGRLRDACIRVTGAPPMRILHDRITLEARRALLYSSMTVAEVAFYLGFNDPAYFSRFFSRAAGCSPRTFRAQHGA